MSTAAKAIKRPRTSGLKIVAKEDIPVPEPVREKGPLKVLLCASEAMPFIKTGGLADVVGALPVALLKPLSGPGARGMMLDCFAHFGPDSFVGHLASVMQGCTDTTFYILAVYFGSVGIKKYRYSVACGLTADIAGMVAAVFFSYFFFG